MTTLTTDVIFEGQHFAILVMFLFFYPSLTVFSYCQSNVYDIYYPLSDWLLLFQLIQLLPNQQSPHLLLPVPQVRGVYVLHMGPVEGSFAVGDEVHCTLHTAHCTLHTAHCTLHTAYCTLHTAHCPLYTAHCIMHTAPWCHHSSTP